MARTSNPGIEQLAHLAHAVRDDLLTHFSNHSRHGQWPELAQLFEVQTGLSEPCQFADAYAQAVVCGSFAARVGSDVFQDPAVANWLVGQADPLVKCVLSDCLSPFAGGRGETLDSPAIRRVAQLLDGPCPRQLQDELSGDHAVDEAPVYFYERFLQCYDRNRRRRRGVFYTPSDLVHFIVRSVDEMLCDEFELVEGLADTSDWSTVAARCGRKLAVSATWAAEPFVRILDPAMGTGAFLLGVVRRCHERFLRADEAHTSSGRLDRWSTYVTEHLLPRMVGLELLLPAVVLAQIQLAAQLARTGFRFPCSGKLHVHLANTLDEPFRLERCLDRDDVPVTVVVGNPPFSGISHNRQPWLRRLVRGQSPEAGREVANYFSIDGRPLGERKHWLEDDYVKFLRYAHWQLERSGAGVIGLVTNHGFLDNPTFRGLRQQLVDTFSHATIVDLHGNAKKQERTPDGRGDQNVFSIEQGVTVSFLRCGTAKPEGAVVEHADLWGRRADKLNVLRSKSCRTLTLQRVRPQSPYYFLTPRKLAGSRHYEQGLHLVDIMPIHSTAAVTARDHFLIDFDEPTLMKRLDVFRDPHVSDEEIRKRFFTRTRSTRYLPGDTRGWQLPAARHVMASLTDLRRHIRDCQYRPFDERKIFWADWMVDWPRSGVMQHLETPGNLALVARRQMPASAPICYFWVTDSIAVDGLIRSDNRGSESVFPLWIDSENESRQQVMPFAEVKRRGRSANFTPAFLEVCCRRLGLTWRATTVRDPESEFGAEDLLHFIYAQFFSPGYRQRFADWLRVDFPRILLPRSAQLFQTMAKCGERLVRLHLLKQPGRSATGLECRGESSRIAPGHPRFEDDRVWINSQAAFTPVPSAVWQFHVGTYQVCLKWLKDRGGRELTETDVRHYSQLVDAVRQTIEIMQQIDSAIEAAGGWGRAF